jgi:hypothetical protein
MDNTKYILEGWYVIILRRLSDKLKNELKIKRRILLLASGRKEMRQKAMNQVESCSC